MFDTECAHITAIDNMGFFIILICFFLYCVLLSSVQLFVFYIVEHGGKLSSPPRVWLPLDCRHSSSSYHNIIRKTREHLFFVFTTTVVSVVNPPPPVRSKLFRLFFVSLLCRVRNLLFRPSVSTNVSYKTFVPSSSVRCAYYDPSCTARCVLVLARPSVSITQCEWRIQFSFYWTMINSNYLSLSRPYISVFFLSFFQVWTLTN